VSDVRSYIKTYVWPSQMRESMVQNTYDSIYCDTDREFSYGKLK
jgi:hypothetical protein